MNDLSLTPSLLPILPFPEGRQGVLESILENLTDAAEPDSVDGAITEAQGLMFEALREAFRRIRDEPLEVRSRRRIIALSIAKLANKALRRAHLLDQSRATCHLVLSRYREQDNGLLVSTQGNFLPGLDRPQMLSLIRMVDRNCRNSREDMLEVDGRYFETIPTDEGVDVIPLHPSCFHRLAAGKAGQVSRVMSLFKACPLALKVLFASYQAHSPQNPVALCETHPKLFNAFRAEIERGEALVALIHRDGLVDGIVRPGRALKFLGTKTDAEQQSTQAFGVLHTYATRGCLNDVFEDRGYIIDPLDEADRLSGAEMRIRMQMARQLVRGVMRAHACQIVCGDIKPENVLVFVRPDGKYEARLGDMDGARLLRRVGNLPACVKLDKLGTSFKAMMAATFTGNYLPKVFSDAICRAAQEKNLDHYEKAQHQRDVWALGYTIAALLTGDEPFENSTDDSLDLRRPRYGEDLKQYPPVLLKIIEGMLIPSTVAQMTLSEALRLLDDVLDGDSARAYDVKERDDRKDS